MKEVDHSAWIPVSFAMPKSGQQIYGAAAKKYEDEHEDRKGYGYVEYHFWLEDEFDFDEPLGAMTHWQPAQD